MAYGNQVVTITNPAAHGITSVTYNPATHTLTFTHQDGSTESFALNDKHVANAHLSGTDFILTMEDGSEIITDLASLAATTDTFVETGEITNGGDTLKMHYNHGGFMEIDISSINAAGGATDVRERGGIEWLAGTTYEAFDIVSILEGGVPVSYVAIISSRNLVPASYTDVCQPISGGGGGGAAERGGIKWATATIYLEDDVVIDNLDKKLYRARANTTGNQPSTSPTQWEQVHNDEKGGVHYAGSTNYEIGDIVTANDGTATRVYRSIANYASATNGTPASFLAEKANWEVVDDERGGVLWENTQSYHTGDIVSHSQVPYIAVLPSAGIPVTDGTHWKVLTTHGEELGGLAWHGAVDYPVGAVTVVGEDIFTSKTNNTGKDPLLNPGDWHKFTASEFGGKRYDPNHNYTFGDFVIVMPGERQYVCVNPTTGTFNAADWKDVR